MKIYRLQEPIRHAAQRAFALAWPQTGLPGINCWGVPNACGKIWTSLSERIRKELPRDHPLHTRTLDPVSPLEFREIVQNVHQVLGLPPETELLPGTLIGLVTLVQKKRSVNSFEWPDFRTTVITDAVRDFLIQHEFTGWHTEPVVFVKGQNAKHLANVHEFVVDGKAAITTNPPASLVSQCEVCGRVERDWSIPDDWQWDETQLPTDDFVQLNPPLAGSVFVSERVKKALESTQFTNYELLPIHDVIKQIIMTP